MAGQYKIRFRAVWLARGTGKELLEGSSFILQLVGTRLAELVRNLHFRNEAALVGVIVAVYEAIVDANHGFEKVWGDFEILVM